MTTYEIYERRRELRREAYNVAIKKLRELMGYCPNGRVTTPCTTDSEDILKVKRLVSQYYYGIAAQNELLDACIALGWINV